MQKTYISWPVLSWSLYTIVVSALCAIFIYFFYYGDPVRYEADSLVFPNLFSFLKNGGNLSDWSLPPAGYYCDLALYYMIRTIWQDVHVAQAATSVAQLLFFYGALLCLAYSINSKDKRFRFYIPLLAMVIAISPLAGGQFFYSGIIVYHFMAFIHIIIAYALLLPLITDTCPHPRRTQLLIFMWGVLCMFSDRITMLWFFIPACTVLALQGYVLRKKDPLKYILLLTASAGTGKFLAFAFSTYFPRGSTVNWASPSLQRLIKNIPDAFTLILNEWTYTSYALTLFLLGSLGLILTAWKELGKNKENFFRNPKALLLLISIVTFFQNIFAIAALGNLLARYAMPAIFLPIYGGVLLLVSYFSSSKNRFYPRFFATIGLSVCGLLAWTTWEERRPAYYPEYIKRLDEAALKYNLQYGGANFWLAHPITALSQSGLTVVPLYGLHLTPNTANVNLATPRSGIDFFLEDTHLERDTANYFAVSSSVVQAINGSPDSVIPIENYQLLIYYEQRGRLASISDLYEEQAIFPAPQGVADVTLWTGLHTFGDGSELLEVRRVFRNNSPYIVMIFSQPPNFFLGKSFKVGNIGNKKSLQRKKMANYLEENPRSIFAPLYAMFYSTRKYEHITQLDISFHSSGNSIMVFKMPDRDSKSYASVYIELDGERFLLPKQ